MSTSSKPDWARDLPDTTPDGDPVVYGPRPLSPRLTSVVPFEGHRLRLRFADGEEREYDVTPLLTRGVFRALVDPAAFATVRVINGGGGVGWDSGPDLSRDTLYIEGVTAPRSAEREHVA